MIQRCQQSILRSAKVVDSDFYIKDSEGNVKENRFICDYPLLYRQKSDNEIVVTNLADVHQSHVCFNLGPKFVFKSFVTTAEFVSEYILACEPSRVSILVTDRERADSLRILSLIFERPYMKHE